jgi:hypothetical protein
MLETCLQLSKITDNDVLQLHEKQRRLGCDMYGNNAVFMTNMFYSETFLRLFRHNTPNEG